MSPPSRRRDESAAPGLIWSLTGLGLGGASESVGAGREDASRRATAEAAATGAEVRFFMLALHEDVVVVLWSGYDTEAQQMYVCIILATSSYPSCGEMNVRSDWTLYLIPSFSLLS